MTQPMHGVVEDRLSVHELLVSRAMAAQDAVFGDASVEKARLIDSVRALAVRLIIQYDALRDSG